MKIKDIIDNWSGRVEDYFRMDETDPSFMFHHQYFIFNKILMNVGNTNKHVWSGNVDTIIKYLMYARKHFDKDVSKKKFKIFTEIMTDAFITDINDIIDHVTNVRNDGSLQRDESKKHELSHTLIKFQACIISLKSRVQLMISLYQQAHPTIRS